MQKIGGMVRVQLRRAVPVLWRLAAAPGGFVLAGASVFGAVHPLGLALVLGARGGTALLASAGAALGCVFLLPAADAARYLGALAAAAAGRLLVRRPSAFWPAAAAGCGTLLLIQTLLAAGGVGGAADWAAAVGDCALAVAFGWAMRRGAASDPSSLLPWAAAGLIGLEQFSSGLFQPAALAFCLLGLIPASRGRVRDAAVLCVVGGAALSAAGSPLAFGLMGPAAGCLAAAVFAPGETAGCAALFFAGALTGVLAAPTLGQAAQLTACAGIACVGFFLLPRRLREAFPGTAAPAAVEGSRPVLAGAGARLVRVADTLEEVADIVNQVCEKLPKKGESYNWVVDHVAEELCRSCANREVCWVAGYSTTMDGFYQLKPVLERQGRAAVEQLPGQFCRCVHPVELCGATSRAYALYRSRREARVQAGAMRAALTEQYGAMADALARIADELNQGLSTDEGKSQRVAGWFASWGLEPLECAVQLDLAGRMQVTVTVSRTAFTAAEQREIAAETGHICRRALGAPEIVHRRTLTTLTLREQPVYAPRFALAGRAARDGVSGDAANQFCDAFGCAHMLLCDGMGTGRPAAVDGNLAARLTGQLVRAGFGGEAAARLVNVALSLKSEEESGATLDLLTVDLYTGKGTIFKAGAAPGFVVRQGKAGVLDGPSLPVGILDKVVSRRQPVTLTEGDLAVLLSDGALADGPAWVTQQLELCAAVGNTPQEIADILAEMAAARQKPGVPPDDITVVVMQLEKAV